MNILLKTDGFIFEIKPDEPLHNWFKGNVYLTSPIMSKDFLLKADVYCPFEDWLTLCNWIEGHIQKLKSNMNELVFVQSDTWTPLDVTMNFTCLAGEFDDNEGEIEGGFGVRIMIKVFAQDSDMYVYNGLEGEVAVNEALTFCQTLREYVNSQTLVAAS